ncbi:MAG: hypothetical protein MRY75_14070 [Marivita sp.]|uniref:hypothetical protein n=1 Tax=Marivita sp. TaxID=2003365 RepID=UPI0025BA5635|nr:hypothetical protein [Marivita sp.]MCI5111672.1 hypothetical protein [Marivita sp.]
MPHVLTNIPVWVLPLFLGLLYISLRATRSRTVPKAVIYALPCLGLLTLRTVIFFDAQWIAIGAFTLAYAAGTALGFRAQGKWTISSTRSHVSLRGEWMTMITVMGVFFLNFATGTINAMAPSLAATPLYAAAFGTLAGGLSGIFFGRALRVMRTATGAT